MILTAGEVNNLRAILYQLRNKASLILNKAERRRGQKATRLHFKEGDFETT